METGGQCYICKKPIQYGEPTCEMDVNITACAAGAGNWQTCHSQCLRGSIIWDTQPKLIGCACRFNKLNDFSAATLVETCGYHSKMRDREACFEELLWRLYEGIYGHRKAEGIDPFKTAVGGALEIKKAWDQRGQK